MFIVVYIYQRNNFNRKKIVMMRGEISGYKDLCTTKENTEKIIFYVNVYY